MYTRLVLIWFNLFHRSIACQFIGWKRYNRLYLSSNCILSNFDIKIEQCIIRNDMREFEINHENVNWSLDKDSRRDKSIEFNVSVLFSRILYKFDFCRIIIVSRKDSHSWETWHKSKMKSFFSLLLIYKIEKKNRDDFFIKNFVKIKLHVYKFISNFNRIPLQMKSVIGQRSHSTKSFYQLLARLHPR